MEAPHIEPMSPPPREQQDALAPSKFKKSGSVLPRAQSRDQIYATLAADLLRPLGDQPFPLGETMNSSAAPSFPNELGEFVYMRTYSRWRSELGRRERWSETVERYLNWLFSGYEVPRGLRSACREQLLSFNLMPSMRALWAAGPAADRDHVCIYNCAFLPIDNLRAFSEALYILMQGTGVGFSVESRFVQALPSIAEPHGRAPIRHQIEDSAEGWADALFLALTELYRGGKVCFDYSALRPKGSLLKTKGGRASGPEPLKRVLDFAEQKIESARGRRLSSLECHDLLCMIAEIVVVGGFRRAAMISFSDPEDQELRHAKDWRQGTFPTIRYMANNSAYYEEKPSEELFWAEWRALAEGGSGERGFSIDNWWRYSGRAKGALRSNPCHEIGLRFRLAEDPWSGSGGAGQFCNLSAAVMRSDDDLESMSEKIRLATWIGCLQAARTNFPYLRSGWAELCNEDRLLGVDITGQCDNPRLSREPAAMRRLNEIARETVREAAECLGIRMPAAITCGKPSGNTSQLVDCASGFHQRHSPYYFRHVRISAGDPLCALIRDQGVPLFKENGQEERPDEEVTTWVARFPVKSPAGALTRGTESAVEQCERYLQVMRSWCHEKGHNQSATIYVRDGEWDAVGAWLYENFEEVIGLSFLPYDGGQYRLAPYVEINAEAYAAAVEEMPSIDFTRLADYEREDRGQGARVFACVGGGCDEIDLPENDEGNRA